MQGINLEVTTCCPLNCPQCYCSLEGGKHLDITVAKKKIDEAYKHGVKVAHISGGETLCYPYIYELVKYIRMYGITVNVALSGYAFDKNVLEKLKASGVSGIFISLNGSSAEINSLTRDGYEMALTALSVLKESKYENGFINWVMHSNNYDDFENMLILAEEYRVSTLVILVFKPDAKHELLTFPTGKQILEIAKKVKNYSGPVKIVVESCFSQLLAVIKDTKLFGNLNAGSTKGCRAGVYNYSISVDGKYSPCRHLDYYEKFDSLDEYLANSNIIKKLHTLDEDIKAPCTICHYKNYCRPCVAVSSKLHGDIFIGHDICGLWNSCQ